MKRKILNTVVVISLVLLVAACSSDENSNIVPNMTSADQISQFAKSGTWEITYFYDTDHDETSNFSGYSFSFNTDGTLSAVNGNSTVSGSWSVQDSDSSNDDSGDSMDDDDFNILFSVSADHDFDDLNDDWDIISATDIKIELIDISGGNGGTDYLTFEKN